jgi:hypothetical protein
MGVELARVEYDEAPLRLFHLRVAIAALSVLQEFTDSAAALLVLRLMIGFLLGTGYVVSKALLTEFTPR